MQTLEEMWQRFAAVSLGENTSPRIINAMRITFFTAVALTLDAMRSLPDDEEHALEAVLDMERQIVEFKELLKMGMYNV
jgi:hypothetical protein